MANRLSGLNATNLVETTFRKLASCLASCHCPKLDASVRTLRGIYLNLKAAVGDVSKGNATLPFLKQFPNKPSELPRELFQAAYPDPKDPPVSFQPPGYTHYLGRIACRRSNALLKEGASTAEPQQSADMTVRALLERLVNKPPGSPEVPIMIYQRGSAQPALGVESPDQALLRALADINHKHSRTSCTCPIDGCNGMHTKKEPLPLENGGGGAPAPGGASAPGGGGGGGAASGGGGASAPGAAASVNSGGASAPDGAPHGAAKESREPAEDAQRTVAQMEALAAATMPSKVRKRPAAAGTASNKKKPKVIQKATTKKKFSGAIPPVPNGKKNETIEHNGGKINVNYANQTFRVFPDKNQLYDRKVFWDKSSKKDAWSQALSHIG